MAWTVVDGPDGNPVLKCVINRYSVSQWFVLTIAGLYDSVDGGATWSTLLAAEEGETFRDVCFSHTRGWIVVMSGGRLAVAIGGVAQTFPVLDPVVSDVVAVAPDITEDRFYCYDASGRTFYTEVDGGTEFVQGADLPAACVVQARGLWRDGAIRGLLYIAGGTGGAWKSLDGFGSSGAYFKIREPGVGNCPANADFRQIGADGLLVGAVPVAPANLVSTAGEGTMLELDGISEPDGWYGTFDDSAWTAPLLQTGGTVGAPPTDAQWIAAQLGTRPWYLRTLHRRTLIVMGSVASGATLETRSDDWVEAVYFNGELVFGPSTYQPYPANQGMLTITIDPGLVVEGENLLAIRYYNEEAGPPNPSSLCYRLEVS
jgi:hypothetical protein